MSELTYTVNVYETRMDAHQGRLYDVFINVSEIDLHAVMLEIMRDGRFGRAELDPASANT